MADIKHINTCQFTKETEYFQNILKFSFKETQNKWEK